MAQIVASRMRTPDGTVLWSHHRHEYVTHTDANGKHYMLDGGTDYIRCSVNGDEVLLTVTTDDPFETRREYFTWGTRGKDGKQPLTWKPLMDLDTDHIVAILETQTHISEWVRGMLATELVFRDEQP
jgi:hypothetical protein